jgi:hypothetical protein
MRGFAVPVGSPGTSEMSPRKDAWSESRSCYQTIPAVPLTYSFFKSPVKEFLVDPTASYTSAWSIARGPSRPFVAVMDSRTGRVVARLDEGLDDGGFRGPEYAVSAMRWEDDTHLLLVVADRTEATIGASSEIQPHQALVRCNVHAPTCELATTPRTTSQWKTAPYGLVG